MGAPCREGRWKRTLRSHEERPAPIPSSATSRMAPAHLVPRHRRPASFTHPMSTSLVEGERTSLLVIRTGSSRTMAFLAHSLRPYPSLQVIASIHSSAAPAEGGFVVISWVVKQNCQSSLTIENGSTDVQRHGVQSPRRRSHNQDRFRPVERRYEGE